MTRVVAMPCDLVVQGEGDDGWPRVAVYIDGEKIGEWRFMCSSSEISGLIYVDWRAGSDD